MINCEVCGNKEVGFMIVDNDTNEWTNVCINEECGGGYWIPADEVVTTEGYGRWVAHLAEKLWFDFKKFHAAYERLMP